MKICSRKNSWSVKWKNISIKDIRKSEDDHAGQEVTWHRHDIRYWIKLWKREWKWMKGVLPFSPFFFFQKAKSRVLYVIELELHPEGFLFFPFSKYFIRAASVVKYYSQLLNHPFKLLSVFVISQKKISKICDASWS